MRLGAGFQSLLSVSSHFEPVFFPLRTIPVGGVVVFPGGVFLTLLG